MGKRIAIILLLGMLVGCGALPETPQQAQSEETKEVIQITIEEEKIAENLNLSPEEKDMLARLVYHEARGESFEGQVAVVEVVLNRVQSASFPNTVAEVIFAPGQFSPAKRLDSAQPSEVQYNAVETALTSETRILSEKTVYFSTSPQNDRISAVIGNHYFCEE